MPLNPATHLERRRALRALGGLALAGAWSAGRASAAFTIRLSHVVAQPTPKGLALQRFKELVEQRSAGRVQVAIYANSSLYGDADEMQALQMGAVDMLAPSLSKFGRIGFSACPSCLKTKRKFAGCAKAHSVSACWPPWAASGSWGWGSWTTVSST
jgi:hypothetical protein